MRTLELSAIGLKAIELQQCIDTRKTASANLKEAYRNWKKKNGLFNIVKDSPDWDRLLDATAPEFVALSAAKKAEKNAANRLSSACTRAMKGVAP